MSAILVGIKRSLEVGINSSQLPKKARKTEGVLMKICQYLPKRFATHNVLVTEDKLERSVRKLGQRKITEYFHTEGPTSIHQTVLCVDNRAGYIRKIISMIPSFPVINIARPFKTYSATYEMGSIDLPNIGIGFINGINNDSDYAKESALRISGYAQGVKV